MNLTDLHTFSLVAATGTISGAAKRIGVPKSTVTRRVRRLEDALGKELLRRAPRSVSLTEHGVALYRRVEAPLQELSDASLEAASSEQVPQGKLRVTTTPGFGQSLAFIRCVQDYMQQYPQVELSLDMSTRVVSLAGEGVDVGFRLHQGSLPGDSATMARRLCGLQWGVYGSPEYLNTHSTPTRLEHLMNHRFGGHVVDLSGKYWSVSGKKGLRNIELPVPSFWVDDSATLLKFAEEGAGLIVVETLLGEPSVETGRLVRVLPKLSYHLGNLSLVWLKSRYLSPRVRAFIDHAVDCFTEPL